jgi:hypothetical protein
MKYTECRLTDELFTFVAHDGFERMWNVSAIQRAVVENRLEPRDRLMLGITDDMANHIAKFNGIEAHHLSSIDDERLKVPVMCLELPKGTHIMIDGNHRVVAAHRRGIQALPAMMFTLGMLKPYEVEGIHRRVE